MSNTVDNFTHIPGGFHRRTTLLSTILYNVMLFIFILCFLVSIAATKDMPVVLCGRRLANARVALCYGVEYVDKRTIPKTFYDRLEDDLWNEYYPWDGRRGALSSDWSRYKRTGLADECCLKPCLPEVILEYC